MQIDLYQLPALKQMENLSRGNNKIISLSQGIPFLPSDARIREFVIDAIKDGKVDRYSEPQGLLSLRELISKKVAQKGMDYMSAEILVTAGAIQALATTLLYMGKDKGEIIIPTPAYSSYFKVAKVAGLTVIPVQLDETNNWSLSIAAIKKQITSQTKAILLCNPNNPTGSVLDKTTLMKLCDLAKKKDFFIILDDVYNNIYFGEQELYHPATDRAYKDHLIRIVSFSKDFSLTGWRVGFIQADATIIKKLLPYHDTLVNCAPVVSQYAAIASLQNEKIIKEYTLATYKENRKIMGEALTDLKDYLEFTWPDGSYFFFPKIKGIKDDVAFCYDLLDKVNIAVVPGSDFGPGGEGHIRLCFGRDPEDIKEAMIRLKGYLKNYA